MDSPTLPLKMRTFLFVVVACLLGEGLASPAAEADSGYGPKCRTVYDTTYRTTYETSYKEECSTSYEKACSTSYKTEYKTEYKQECSTSYEKQCSTSYETSYKQECSTSYKEECSGYGYHKKCHKVPQQHCTQVPVQKPVQQCH